VVVLPDRLIDSEHKLAERFESCRIAEVDLELRIEGLLVAVLPWAAWSRAGDQYPDGLQCFNEHRRVVFAAVVAVEDEWPSMVVQRIHECCEDELYGMIRIHRNANDFSRVQINNGGDVHEPPLERDIREVGSPDMIFIQRTSGHQQIRIDDLDSRGFAPFLAPSTVCLDAEDIHHSLHLLAVHGEMYGEPTRAV